MTICERLKASGFVAQSQLMRQVVALIEKAAASRTGVLISGETGTGRGLVAKAIHTYAQDGGGPFITIDGNELLPSEAESRIFGVPAKGHRDGIPRAGDLPEVVYPGSVLHRALGGTVFFRHLEELPVRAQARLATLFRDCEYLERPGGDAIPFAARPIAAVGPTHQSHVDDGRVRLDLHRRFAEFRIALPSLRERYEDIPELAQGFITRACRARHIPERALDPAAQAVLAALPWPGNLRELRERLEDLIETAPEDGPITLHALLDHVSLEGRREPRLPIGAPLREARQRFEREYISAVVARHHGRIPDAAKSLGIQRTNLYRKLRKLRSANPL
jgi:two-component system, NtrC family, nitrogen regulation response regulator NtrX